MFAEHQVIASGISPSEDWEITIFHTEENPVSYNTHEMRGSAWCGVLVLLCVDALFI